MLTLCDKMFLKKKSKGKRIMKMAIKIIILNGLTVKKGLNELGDDGG